MNANEVIRIGRSRSRHASSIASRRARPACSRTLANSTIRIAFFAASPTSTIRPICVSRLLSWPRIENADHGEQDAQRDDQDDASGSDQLSNCAASVRKTKTTESAKTTTAVSPVRSSW